MASLSILLLLSSLCDSQIPRCTWCYEIWQNKIERTSLIKARRHHFIHQSKKNITAPSHQKVQALCWLLGNVTTCWFLLGSGISEAILDNLGFNRVLRAWIYLCTSLSAAPKNRLRFASRHFTVETKFSLEADLCVGAPDRLWEPGWRRWTAETSMNHLWWEAPMWHTRTLIHVVFLQLIL